MPRLPHLGIPISGKHLKRGVTEYCHSLCERPLRWRLFHCHDTQFKRVLPYQATLPFVDRAIAFSVTLLITHDCNLYESNSSIWARIRYPFFNFPILQAFFLFRNECEAICRALEPLSNLHCTLYFAVLRKFCFVPVFLSKDLFNTTRAFKGVRTSHFPLMVSLSLIQIAAPHDLSHEYCNVVRYLTRSFEGVFMVMLCSWKHCRSHIDQSLGRLIG